LIRPVQGIEVINICLWRWCSHSRSPK